MSISESNDVPSYISAAAILPLRMQQARPVSLECSTKHLRNGMKRKARNGAGHYATVSKNSHLDSGLLKGNQGPGPISFCPELHTISSSSGSRDG